MTERLRPAVHSDFAAYLRLKSDPLAIQWSGFVNAPNPDRLLKHFTSLLESDSLVYMFERDTSVIGYIQLNRNPNEIEVAGYSVLSECTGKGYGKKIIHCAIGIYPPPYIHLPIIAWVSEHNLASIRCFEENNFTRDYSSCKQVELPALGRTDNFIKFVHE